MSDRFNGLQVVFDQTLSEYDAKKIKEAIEQLRGVIRVEPVISTFEDQTIFWRVKKKVEDAFWRAIQETQP